jgi:hypothetical protein
VGHVRTCFRVGTRRACRVLALHRSMYLYRSRRPEQAVLRKRIREIAAMRFRYGYRRIHILQQREGCPVGERVYIGFIGWRGCKCAINHLDGGSWPNSERTGQQRLRPTTVGR